MKILKLKGMFARSNRLLKNAFSALSVLIFSCGIISEARAEVTCVWSETNPTELIVSGEGILTGGTYGVCPAGFASTVTSVTFAEGSNITEIDSHAFYGASKLTGIDLPNTLTRIGHAAFQGATSLKSITIPASVTKVEEDAFYGSELEYIIFSEGINLDKWESGWYNGLDTSWHPNDQAHYYGVLFVCIDKDGGVLSYDLFNDVDFHCSVIASGCCEVLASVLPKDDCPSGINCGCETPKNTVNWYGHCIDPKSVVLGCPLANCNACLGGVCQTCNDGYFVQGEKCVAVCDKGYFKNNGICEKCDDDCATCTKSGECTSCDAVNGYHLSADNQCIKCLDNEYYSSTEKVCTQCDVGCATCSGSGSCSTCDEENGYHLSAGQCIKCNNGEYYSSTEKECKQCDVGCTTCTGSGSCTQCDEENGYRLSAGQCIKCNNGEYYSSTDQACKPCGGGCKICTENGECTQCYDGYYYSSDDKECKRCDDGCKTCTKSGECETCADGIEPSCLDGYYLNDAKNDCLPCDDGCATCTEAGSCESCKDGYLWKGEKCVTECGYGYFTSGNICEACDEGCKICSGKGSCDDCFDDYNRVKLVNGEISE